MAVESSDEAPDEPVAHPGFGRPCLMFRDQSAQRGSIRLGHAMSQGLDGALLAIR